MNVNRYYVKIDAIDKERFEKYLLCSNLEHKTTEIPDGTYRTSLYEIYMDAEAALSMTLAFPLIGYVNFDKTPGQFITFGKT
ncbi:MAG TPA: hypothetical protein VIY47_03405 [Ignavibacteriaceae bacterium]